jgi:hypothetical protein
MNRTVTLSHCPRLSGTICAFMPPSRWRHKCDRHDAVGPLASWPGQNQIGKKAQALNYRPEWTDSHQVTFKSLGELYSYLGLEASEAPESTGTRSELGTLDVSPEAAED